MGPPFGLKGFVKVKPLSGETGHFSCLDKVRLRQAGKEEDRELAELVLQGDSLLLRFAGIDSPEAAKLLAGAEIIVERKYAAPLKEGEYYVEDLKGLELVGPQGETLGHIRDVIEGGGGNLAEIELPSGERRFAPFRNEFFGEVKLKEGKVVLNEPWVLES
ncbi:MAG: ribosome maturation factor RimM [Treponema sp.]|nr:ribosome maturation factor RimM [Treponema sp.]